MTLFKGVDSWGLKEHNVIISVIPVSNLKRLDDSLVLVSEVVLIACLVGEEFNLFFQT